MSNASFLLNLNSGSWGSSSSSSWQSLARNFEGEGGFLSQAQIVGDFLGHKTEQHNATLGYCQIWLAQPKSPLQATRSMEYRCRPGIPYSRWRFMEYYPIPKGDGPQSDSMCHLFHMTIFHPKIPKALGCGEQRLLKSNILQRLDKGGQRPELFFWDMPPNIVPILPSKSLRAPVAWLIQRSL
ncbi:hypothetical protein DFH07DRAFT_770704 [Mycena maculata]|uniref:Uncharacterized protein n=1 Tax=Mycena maculata TaxID=230809 RepID=A0AAD7NKD4_9AGAR|nr:hypothetical protein DFH07DRAFT_770704 [Mycena maculata]